MIKSEIIKMVNHINKFLKEKSGFSLWIWIFFAILAGIKLFLVNGQHEFAIGVAAHDDRLFINQALNLMHLDWLGEYGNMTLAKGPFYPMWIALNHALRIPLLLSEQLLYIFATIILVLALRPAFNRKWPFLFAYAIILFNPVSFANDPATRVIREGIYQPLTLLVAALFIGLVLRLKDKPKKMLFWSLLAGLTLSAFWLTREEGVWLSPFLAIILVYSIYFAWKEKLQPFKKIIFLIFLPLIILFFSINLISAINYFEYGVYNVVEFKAPQFLSAYGALTRVKAPVWMADVPVSAAQRQIIYSVSPAFSELKPFLEGNIGKGWVRISDENAPSENNGEIKGGWFMWAFRDAVAQAKDEMRPVYRLYSPTTGSHFFTIYNKERKSLEGNSKLSIESEGIAFYAFSDASTDKRLLPVYKFSNTNDDFYFSTSPNTEDDLQVSNSKDFSSKTIAFYAYPDARNASLPVYDLYDEKNNKHFYTISETEKDSIIKNTDSLFRFEGIAFYAYPQSKGIYYMDGKSAMAYYKRLASEVNSACDSGKIPCTPKRASMNPPWNSGYNKILEDSLFKSVSFISSLEGFSATPSESIGKEDQLELFSHITYESVNLSGDSPSKLKILNDIVELYRYIMPFILYLSLVIFFAIFFFLRAKVLKNIPWIISLSLLGSICARILILSIIETTSFHAIIILYFSSIYPLVFLFILLNLIQAGLWIENIFFGKYRQSKI